MRSLILTLLVLQVFLPGAFSVEERKPKPVMCKNPKAKEGSSVRQGCSTATCRRDGKKGVWQQCPTLALEKTVIENQRKIEKNHEVLKEMLEILGQPSCCPTIQTTTWRVPATTILEDDNLSIVYNNPQEFDIKNNNLVTELDVLGQEYILSFDILLASVNSETYKNIIHLTIGSDNDVYGDRTPGVWLYKDQGFMINSAINGIKDKGKYIYPSIKSDRWIHFDVSQQLVDNKYKFEVKVDEISFWVIENTAAKAFDNVKVFAGRGSTPTYAKMKNLKVQTKIQGCDSTWTNFGSYCYKFFPVQKISWNEASIECAGQGGFLASIHSAEENQFLVNLSPQNSTGIWIGGNDLDTEGTFVWTDGSAWDYQNWSPSQPDNHSWNGGEHCVELGYANAGETFWNDLPCNLNLRQAGGFICKK